MSNADNFRREMEAEVEAKIALLENAMVKTGVYGWSLVTSATPVLTGRARASTLLTVDVVRDSTVKKVSGSDRVYPDPRPRKISFDIKRNQAIIISNNVEYIEVLESGGPNRTPFAMFTMAKPKIDRELNRRLRALR